VLIEKQLIDILICIIIATESEVSLSELLYHSVVYNLQWLVQQLQEHSVSLQSTNAIKNSVKKCQYLISW